jgi:hypothetical protein
VTICHTADAGNAASNYRARFPDPAAPSSTASDAHNGLVAAIGATLPGAS